MVLGVIRLFIVSFFFFFIYVDFVDDNCCVSEMIVNEYVLKLKLICYFMGVYGKV